MSFITYTQGSTGRPSAPVRFLAMLIIVAVVLAAGSAWAVELVRIQCVGDSITAGYTDNSAWNVPFEFGYRSGLYTRLTTAGYSFQFVGTSPEPWDGQWGVPKYVGTPNLRTVNQDNHRGYGGRGTSYVSSNISGWLAADNPDVVLLMIGINDIGQDTSGNPTTAESNLNSIVQTIVTARPNAYVIVAQTTGYATYTDSIVQYNNYIKNTMVPAFVAQGKHISTVDQYSNMLTNGSINPALFSNGINHPGATAYGRMAQTWFDAIQALGTITPSPLPALPVLSNGNFETPAFSGTSHNINASNASWQFGPASHASGAGAGIDRGDPYGTGKPTIEGSQVGFLQGSGTGYGVTSIAQNLTGLVPGRNYTISFKAKGITGFGGANPFHVSVAEAELAFGGKTLVTPTGGTVSTYTSATFTATSATETLRFYDAGSVDYTKVSFIDSVMVAVSTPTGNLVGNGGFETMSFANNSHNVNPSGAGWRFTSGVAGAGSGIDRGSPYTGATNSSPSEGLQMAFLQGSGNSTTSSIEQDVAGLVAGRQYVVSFEAKAVAGSTGAGANPFQVSVGGQDLTFGGTPLVSPSTACDLYMSDPFTATSSTQTLRFYDAGSVSSTLVSWIDDVQMTAVPEPGTLVLVLAAGLLGLLCYSWRKRAA
jgi:lysophospholipase L1-like esterase